MWPSSTNLGAGRHLQLERPLADAAVGDLGAAAAQQAGELVLRQGVGHRGDGAEDRGRVGAQRHDDRERPARVGAGEIAEVERATAVRQPAHDHLAAADHLLPVDTQVLARARRRHRLRSTRDRQAPGDQRARIVGPAGLDRQARQVDVVAFEHDLLARRAAHRGRLHVPHGLDHLQQPPGVLQAARRLGLLQAGQHPADVAQPATSRCAHAQGHAFGGAEQVDQGGYLVTHWMFNQHRRPPCAQHAVSKRCHLKPRRHGLWHPTQLAEGFELGHEVAQIPVFHRFDIVLLLKSIYLTGYYAAS